MNNIAVVIRHVAFEDLGSFAAQIEEAGLEIVYVEAASTGLAQLDAVEAALLVVLGGPISVNDIRDYPFLVDEIGIIRRRIERDLPTLGICLGAQLMARALGADVMPGGEKEIGWYPIELTDAGRASPLRHLVDGNAPVLHWHGETFGLPAGANLLASSARYRNQAFSYGRRTLALQFHPEITAAGLEQWFVGHTGEIAQTPGLSVTGLREDTGQYAPGLAVRGQRFMREWLQAVLRNRSVQP